MFGAVVTATPNIIIAEDLKEPLNGLVLLAIEF